MFKIEKHVKLSHDYVNFYKYTKHYTTFKKNALCKI